MSELGRLPAGDVFAYAAACVEYRAAMLAESMDVALVSAEAMSGGNSLRKQLRRDIQRMFGESPRAASTAERAAIAEVEREIAREFPFYFDDARLSELHERFGRLRLG